MFTDSIKGIKRITIQMRRKRMRHLLVSLLTFAMFLVISPVGEAKTVNELNKDEAFHILEEAFQSQVSLSEESRNMNEIKTILNQHFSDEYSKEFIEMNVQESTEGKGYQTYGTDVAIYYIPFFSYNDKTKIGYNQKNEHWYVYEWFEEQPESPVGKDGHYEAVGLIYQDGKWMIDDYQITFDPETVSNQEEKRGAVEQSTKIDSRWHENLIGNVGYAYWSNLTKWFEFYPLPK